MSGINHRTLLPVVWGVRDTSPPTPRKVKVSKPRTNGFGIGRHMDRVPEVRWRWERGGSTMKMIAAEMALPYDFVRKVCLGDMYPHIKAAEPQGERKAA